MFVDRRYKQGRFPDSLAGMVVRCSTRARGLPVPRAIWCLIARR
jgi:hypothetical protein